jgi:hypothetical protein
VTRPRLRAALAATTQQLKELPVELQSARIERDDILASLGSLKRRLG